MGSKITQKNSEELFTCGQLDLALSFQCGGQKLWSHHTALTEVLCGVIQTDLKALLVGHNTNQVHQLY